MDNQMLDGNSAAELDNDTRLTVNRWDSEEGWMSIRDALLRGEAVENDFGRKFTLNNRLGEEYVEFSDLIDKDFDIMAAYNRGELHPAVRDLIYNEACTLASVVVG